MGGLARAAGESGLIAPLWLIGGDVSLPDAAPGPVIWWASLDDPAIRRRADAIAPIVGETADFAHRRDAGERLVRRRLARLLLAAISGVDVARIAIGRDLAGASAVAVPAGHYLSVAARWPALLIGVARYPLGVDLERDDGAAPTLDLLTAAERSWLAGLAAADRPAAFTRCWAMKEAHAKWSGTPSAVDPSTVETRFDGEVRSPAGTTRCWCHRDGDLVGSCATALTVAT